MGYFLNQINIIGNVTKRPEMTYTPNGTAVVKFSVATNRSIKRNDEWESVATFHNVTVYGKMAEWIVERILKGDKVFVGGRQENRSYEKDGVRKYYSEIVANEIVPMVKQKGDRTTDPDDEADSSPDQEPQPDTYKEDPKSEGYEEPDDLPF